jgi:general nucleoside transport system permease protein
MFRFRIERAAAPFWLLALLPLLSVLVTFLLVSVLIIAAGANPLSALVELVIAPLTRASARADILMMATPLIMTGVAVAVAFTGGYYNIGAEGQLFAGAIAAAWVGIHSEGLPPFAAICLMLIGGFIAGMLWSLVPALLKVYLAVDEVVTTLLLNSVMLYIVSALLNGPWRDPVSGWPQSPTIALAAQFPVLIPRSRVHLGLLVAIGAALVIWWMISRTRFGLELRAIGKNRSGAQFMGIPVQRRLLAAALISGGIAGMAGVGEVGGIHYYLTGTLSPGFGYTGIIVATLGLLTMPGVVLSALFLALINRGAISANRELDVPVYLSDIIQAVLLLVTLAMLLLNRYRIRRG